MKTLMTDDQELNAFIDSVGEGLIRGACNGVRKHGLDPNQLDSNKKTAMLVALLQVVWISPMLERMTVSSRREWIIDTLDMIIGKSRDET